MQIFLTRRLAENKEQDENEVAESAVAGVPSILHSAQVKAATVWTVESCSAACFAALAPDNSYFVVRIGLDAFHVQRQETPIPCRCAQFFVGSLIASAQINIYYTVEGGDQICTCCKWMTLYDAVRQIAGSHAHTIHSTPFHHAYRPQMRGHQARLCVRLGLCGGRWLWFGFA
jgi:hypothetical protein